MSSDKLIHVYKTVLAYAGMEADTNGLITNVILGNRSPAVIEEKRLVLPLSVQLKNFIPDEKVIFHPLSENILRGESLVLSYYKKALNVKINTVIGILGSSLLSIVSSPKIHQELSPEQTELLYAVKDCDAKTCSNFVEIMVSITKSRTDRCFSNIYLKRGGTYKNEKYSRVGIVNFPFYQDLIADKVDKLRVKDKATFTQLFEFMFPEISIPEGYNYGTHNQTAPYFECLMQTSANLTSRLNDLINIYGKYIDRAEELKFDSDWLEYFSSIDKLLPDIRRVPVQYGNDGTLSITDVKEEPQVQPTYLPPPVLQQPQQVQTSLPVQQQPQYNQQQQYPVANQQPVRPGIEKTSDGKLKFSSIANDPSLMYAGNMAPPMGMPPMGMMPMQQGMMPGYPMPPQMQGYPQQQMMPPQMQQGPMVIQTPNGPMLQYPNGMITPYR